MNASLILRGRKLVNSYNPFADYPEEDERAMDAYVAYYKRRRTIGMIEALKVVSDGEIRTALANSIAKRAA